MTLKGKFITALCALQTALLCSLAAEPVRVYTTKADGSMQMDYSLSSSRTVFGSYAIKVNPSKTYQEIDGFGYAITYSACYNMLKMNPAHRREFLTRTFSRTEGYGVSYVRISIGCSDFSSREYTLCDQQGLEHFALQSDETDYVIPILKEILEINPDLKVMAAPWTCPKWMKIKALNNPVGYDSWTSGVLNPKYYETYAEYFVKFVQAFQAEGISIYAVTPQNEPLNKGNSASLYLPWDQEAELINRMAPAFHKAGIRTKIYCFDHNYNYDNISDQNDYPVRLYNALDKGMDGFDLVMGTAWHNYGGNVAEISDISGQLPEWENIFTESSIGTWNDGRNLSARLLWDTQEMVYNTVTRGCRAVMMWNFMLDLNRSPYRPGGCSTCYGAVDIDQNDYHTLTYNSHYFLIAHASTAAQPGAVRVEATGSIPDVQYIAFKNPDESYGAIIINNGSTQRAMSFGVEKTSVAKFSLPGKSIVSVVLGGKDDDGVRLAGQSILATNEVGHFTANVQAEQMQQMEQNFITDPSEWHIDPTCFLFTDDNQLLFLPTSGKYKVDIDRCAHRLRAIPQDETEERLYISSLANSLNPNYYYPVSKSEETCVLPMVVKEPGMYEYAFTVGSEFNPAVVNFAFYKEKELTTLFSGKSGAEHYLTYDMGQGITFFGMGRGASGHADGHMYKRATTAKIEDGATFIITVDLRAGDGAGVVYVRKADPEEMLTGIRKEEASATSEGCAGMYDLMGRKLTKVPSGMPYICNGKLFIQ